MPIASRSKPDRRLYPPIHRCSAVDPPRKSQIRATYERIADSFAETRTTPWPEVLAFARQLPPRSRVLDLGCGHGRHARPVAGMGHRVVGIDFSSSLLRLAASASTPGATLEWLLGDATRIPLADGSVDACLCVAVLHHLPSSSDRLQALREIRRVLRQQGSVFLSVWDADQPRFRDAMRSEDHDAWVPWTLPDGTTVDRYYHLFTQEELERLIIESGLHGERFFRVAENIFAQASRHG